jgi:glutathione S-transferase
MVFIKDPKNNDQQLIRCLEKVDAHLRDINQTFMLKDTLTRADCYLLPSLQHIRVAGKVRLLARSLYNLFQILLKFFSLRHTKTLRSPQN